MGPGILVKAILRGSFSLMVFGWAQIVMDIQPLFVLITGEGHLHGFSHTVIGATLLAVFSALTGKYLSEFGLRLLGVWQDSSQIIAWWVVWLSAFIGTYSHVALDAVMHSDVEPWWPWSLDNVWYGWLSAADMHLWCLYSGGIGGSVYLLISAWSIKRS